MAGRLNHWQTVIAVRNDDGATNNGSGPDSSRTSSKATPLHAVYPSLQTQATVPERNEVFVLETRGETSAAGASPHEKPFAAEVDLKRLLPPQPDRLEQPSIAYRQP
jgi:hypothetical protein